MANEIEFQNLKNDYPDFFRETPRDLIDFIFLEKTSSRINDICTKNGVPEKEKIEGVAYRTVWVLLGRLPKENLALTFELGLKIPTETAKKIADEINQFIASSDIKPKPEIIPQVKPEIKTEKPINEGLPKRPPSNDTYREKIE